MKYLMEQLTLFAARHRTTCLLALILLGLSAGLSLFRVHFTNDVSRMFPDSRDAGATFRILKETRLGNTVQLEFICRDSVEKQVKYLDSVAEKIKKLPGVRDLVFRYRTGDPMDELTGFTSLLPRFSGPEILRQCDPETAAKNALKQLTFPVPGGVKLLRNQPFGLNRKILQDLNTLDEMAGMKIAPDLPYFASRDKHRAMILFDADLQIGDAAAVRKLLKQIHEAAEPLPEGMRLRIISGIMHTLGNEEVLKRDAAVSGTVSLLLFLLIFVFCYRGDLRALWIPVIPLYASLLSLGIMTCFFREICLYVIGLGSCITGLAVDQGIHVYAAFRGKQAEQRTAALTEPMLLSAGTSILVFIFLGFTGISAYIQLAVFAGLSLAFSCVIALVILPLLLDREHRIMTLETASPQRKISVLFLLPILPILFFGGKVLLKNADFSLDSLDGTPREIRAEEQDFDRVWRSPGFKTAVLAASGTDSDEALRHLHEFAGQLSALKIQVAVPPVPPRSVQSNNRAQWRTAGTAKRIGELEKETRLACKKFRLPEAFFQPFFDRLRQAVRSDGLDLPPLLESVSKKMVKENGRTASAVALLKDTENNARTIREVLKKQPAPHCALLSKEGFRQMVREDLGGRFLWILPLSILAALLLAYLVFRRLSDVLLAMVPVLVSFCGLFLLGAVTGFKATPAAAFALILLTGLAIDYGIYAVSQLRHPEEISVRSSVLLSAATTVAGAGALVFSKHPALFGTGIVLAVGITLACLSGLFLVPMLKTGKKSSVLPAVLFLFLLTGCASGIRFEEFPEAAQLRQRMDLYPENNFKIQANAVICWQGHKHTAILAAELDRRNGKLKAAGIHPASGTLIFRVDSTHKNDYLAPFRPGLMETAVDTSADRHQPFFKRMGLLLSRPFRWCHARIRLWHYDRINRELALALTEDFRRIFLLNRGKQLAAENKPEYIAVYAEDDTEWEIRRDSCVHKKGSGWSCEYRDRGKTVLYRNHQWDYTIRLKIVREQTEKSQK